MADVNDSIKDQNCKHQNNDIKYDRIQMAKAIEELYDGAKIYEEIVFQRLQSLDDLEKKITLVNKLSLALSRFKFELVVALEHQLLDHSGIVKHKNLV